MDEVIEHEERGLLSRVKRLFRREDEDDEYEEEPYELPTMDGKRGFGKMHQLHPYNVCVRMHVNSFEDARQAADGLKYGEQQILNMLETEPGLRQTVVDFLSGVVYAQEGSVEKLAEHVYLFAPRQAVVDVSPPSPRVASMNN
ncbi:MAG: cell division protein SepF [Fimbriimonadia bacterium]|jgi:cell division inhibitor SepF